jgi:CDP-paratose 2-epimerase
VIFDAQRPVLITGGAGFIGTNLADRLLSAGQPVLIYDNLARRGTDQNLRWLQARHGAAAEAIIADVRDRAALTQAVNRACRVFHFAAQVAVTTSLEDPEHDFQVNAGGTLQLLEAIRCSPARPPLLYTSTNKVYGALDGLMLHQSDDRCAPTDFTVRVHGIDERWPLQFHSPYGCSKGAADQYVLDYARIFGLSTCVFRMSCIYGPHQRGTEDQGWVAHFVLQCLADRPLTIWGDGCQVRDVLYVDDLMTAMLSAQENIDRLSGQAFNIGGGPGNAVSLREVLAMIRAAIGRGPEIQYAPFRPADQRYYVSDTRAFSAATGWRVRVGAVEGVRRLIEAMQADQGASRRAASVQEAGLQP